MMALDAIELLDREHLKLSATWELLFRMLHALVQAEHPYAYLVATERRATRPHA
jgi:hypothetical protein